MLTPACSEGGGAHGLVLCSTLSRLKRRALGLGKGLNSFRCIALWVLHVPITESSQGAKHRAVYSTYHILTTSLRNCDYVPTQDEPTETLKVPVTCPRSYIQKVGSKGKIQTRVSPRALFYPIATNSLGRTTGALDMGRSGGQAKSAAESAQLLSRNPPSAQSLTDNLDNCN